VIATLPSNPATKSSDTLHTNSSVSHLLYSTSYLQSVRLGGASRQVDVVKNIIVESFLMIIDPRLHTPPIDRDTIHDLLQMAHKYQSNSILQWFEQEALVERINHTTQSKSESLLATYPKLLLSLAIRFDLRETAKIALKELVGCDYNVLIENQIQLALHSSSKSAKSTTDEFGDVSRPLTCWRGVEHGTRDTQKTHGNSVVTNICFLLSALRTERCWIPNMDRAVQRRPKSAAFIQAYNSDDTFLSCEFSWSERFSRMKSRWSREYVKDR
jgi:hypothetical protein